MSNDTRKTLRRTVIGTSLLGGLAIAGQSFAMTALDGGYMQGDQAATTQSASKGKEGACGEGKCGGSMAASKSAKPTAKAGEGHCGMAQMDSDKDGRISRSEFAAAHDGKDAKFDGIDSDHDGYISQAEMDAHHASMKKAGGEGGCGAKMHGKPADKH